MHEITVEPALIDKLGRLEGQTIYATQMAEPLVSSLCFPTDRWWQICNWIRHRRLRKQTGCALLEPASS
jgi:hypothetical protein